MEDASLSLQATASSGLTVSYSSSNPAVATVQGNTLTLVGPGTTVITASQAGNDDFDPASLVTQSLIVRTSKQPQTITFSGIAQKTFGDNPILLQASTTSGLPLSFSIVSGPATLVGSTLTLTSAGFITVKASQAGNDSYLAAEVIQSFEVSKALQTLTFAAIPDKILGDTPFVLSASSSAGLPISFLVVSGPAVVSGSKLTIAASGQVKVQAIQLGNENYLPTAIEQSFIVNLPLAIDPVASMEVQTFPNPTTDELTISLPSSVKQAYFVLINATGQTVLESKTLSSSPTQIRVAHLPKGFYVLRITYKQTVLTKKILIQ